MSKPIGLYTHIQNNNIKSFTLFVCYILLLQLLLLGLFAGLAAMETGQLSWGAPNKTIGAFHMMGQTIAQQSKTPGLDIIVSNDLASSFGLIAKFMVKHAGLYSKISLGLFFYCLVWVTWRCSRNSSNVKSQTSARTVTKSMEPRLFRLLEPLIIMRGLPMPILAVMETSQCNAYASGWTPHASTIGVTRGLLNSLDDIELQCVLAHEIAHIENRDNRLISVADACSSVLVDFDGSLLDYYKANLGAGLAILIGFIFFPLMCGIVIGTYALVMAFKTLVRHSISKSRELIADGRAVEMVKRPDAMVSALKKISQNDRIPDLKQAVHSMMISDPSGGKSSSHPDMEQRIRAIRNDNRFQTNVQSGLAPPTLRDSNQMFKSNSAYAKQPNTFGRRR